MYCRESRIQLIITAPGGWLGYFLGGCDGLMYALTVFITPDYITGLLSPNHSGRRTHPIDRITPHCVAGQCSVETLGDVFQPASRRASSNYGIGPDGCVGLYVEEKNRSWCSSSQSNDQRAVTIREKMRCTSSFTPGFASRSSAA